MKINSICKICGHTIKEHYFYNGGECKCCFAGMKRAWSDNAEPDGYSVDPENKFRKRENIT